MAGQDAEDPSQTNGAHEGLPALPAAIGLHVPTLPATLQASHAPSQAVSQHTPSTQLPLEHWPSAPQDSPALFFSSQAPLAPQKNPSAHCASAVQPAGQAPESPPHTYAPHEGVPAVPGGTGVQLPPLPVRLQASHAPSQAALQHTPSTQWLLPHCSARVQDSPLPTFGTQAPSWQYESASQLALESQWSGHAEPVPSQR